MINCSQFCPNFAFNFNLRRCTTAVDVIRQAVEEDGMTMAIEEEVGTQYITLATASTTFHYSMGVG